VIDLNIFPNFVVLNASHQKFSRFTDVFPNVTVASEFICDSKIEREITEKPTFQVSKACNEMSQE